MISIQLWFNSELLPTKEDRQKSLHLILPQLYLWGVSAPTKIGILRTKPDVNSVTHFEIQLVIFGFGFIYNENYDI